MAKSLESRRFNMKSLEQAVKEYINYRCSLGFTLTHDKSILNHFVEYMKEKKATYITTKHATAFAKLNPQASRVNWAVRLATIRRFAEYWVYMDARTEIPTQHLGSCTYPRRAPYIYSDGEIRRILEYCERFSSTYEIERYSFFTWYGLLAVTGMRIGEVARLDRNDLNLAEGIITIHNSKFKRSRHIPLHRSTVDALKSYLNYRDLCIPKPKTPRLFIDHLGGPLSAWKVRKVFRQLLSKVGIQRASNDQPKIMSLRHTFAVNTLIRWYKHRVNIDQHIPLLSTYLGHVHLRYTYWYITATPELLQLIASRLEDNKRGNL
jgi:integrase/recombinase XerD